MVAVFDVVGLAVHRVELGTQHPANQVVQMHPGVQHRSQWMLRLAILPFELGVRQALRRGQGAHGANAMQLLSRHVQRLVVAQRLREEERCFRRLDDGSKLACCIERVRERLLEEHGLAAFERPACQVEMRRRWRDDHHGIHVGRVEERRCVRVPGGSELAAETLGLRGVAPAYGGQRHVRKVVDDVSSITLPVHAEADESHAHHACILSRARPKVASRGVFPGLALRRVLTECFNI